MGGSTCGAPVFGSFKAGLGGELVLGLAANVGGTSFGPLQEKRRGGVVQITVAETETCLSKRPKPDRALVLKPRGWL